MKKILAVGFCVCFISGVVSADLISVRGIDLEFVTIGNPGNPGDTRGGGLANPIGCGAVDYTYQIGKYEISASQWSIINGAVNIDNSWSYSGNTPVGSISWYDAARFCNYLTTGNTENGVYTFTSGSLTSIMDHGTAGSTYGRAFFLPTEDEWYKAAYYTGSGYSTYANGQETIPAADYGWNYYGGAFGSPWPVYYGTEEQNGTFNMMGNVWEWIEVQFGSTYSMRGGHYYNDPFYLSSSKRGNGSPSGEAHIVGFRVASIPEPTSLVLLGLGGLVLRCKRS